MKNKIALVSYLVIGMLVAESSFAISMYNPRVGSTGAIRPTVVSSQQQTTAAAATNATTSTAAIVADPVVQADFVDKYKTYKQSLDNSKKICNASSGTVDDTISQLGMLLGAGIGEIAGGVIGAGAGGVNIYLTGKTIQGEKSLEDLQKKADADKLARKSAYDSAIAAADAARKNVGSEDEVVRAARAKLADAQAALALAQNNGGADAIIDPVFADCQKLHSLGINKDSEKSITDTVNGLLAGLSDNSSAQDKKCADLNAAKDALDAVNKKLSGANKTKNDSVDVILKLYDQASNNFDAAHAGWVAKKAKYDELSKKISDLQLQINQVRGDVSGTYPTDIQTWQIQVAAMSKKTSSYSASDSTAMDAAIYKVSSNGNLSTSYSTTKVVEEDGWYKIRISNLKLEDAKNIYQRAVAYMTDKCRSKDPARDCVPILLDQNGKILNLSGNPSSELAMNILNSASGRTDNKDRDALEADLAKAKADRESINPGSEPTRDTIWNIVVNDPNNKSAVNDFMTNCGEFPLNSITRQQIIEFKDSKKCTGSAGAVPDALAKQSDAQKILAAAQDAAKGINCDKIVTNAYVSGTKSKLTELCGTPNITKIEDCNGGRMKDARDYNSKQSADKKITGCDDIIAHKPTIGGSSPEQIEALKGKVAAAQSDVGFAISQVSANADNAYNQAKAAADAELNKPSESESKLKALQDDIASKQKTSKILDITGIASGVGTGVAGVLGISNAKNIGEALDNTASDVDACDKSLKSSKMAKVDLQDNADKNYDQIKDTDEYKQWESQQTAVANQESKCNSAFNGSDFTDLQSQLKSAGISNTIALVGAVGTTASSAGAMIVKEDETKKTWRIASTVSSGVSGVSGVISTVLASRIKKMLAVAKNNETNCLDAINAVKL